MDERIGHYRIVSELGRGGMGVVYKAQEESLNRYVALKVLGEHLSEEETFVARFVREAQSAASLQHPNIVQIFFIGEDEGKHYFAMEFVEGQSLRDVIAERGRLPVPEALDLLVQAASGLRAAHDRGVLHRDIKPANLMLTPDGRIKIADFGLALPMEAATRLTATGALLGTPAYVSPEQCEGLKPDRRSDIYSLGLTFYEMLTGKMPFQADSPMGLLRQIVQSEPPPVRELNPDVDPHLAEILGRMIAKDPEQRYTDCRDVLADLEGYRQGKGRPGMGSGLPAAAPSTLPPPPPGTVPVVGGDRTEEATIVLAEETSLAPRPEVLPAVPVDTSGRRRRATILALAIGVLLLASVAVAAVFVWSSGIFSPLRSKPVAALLGGEAAPSEEAAPETAAASQTASGGASSDLEAPTFSDDPPSPTRESSLPAERPSAEAAPGTATGGGAAQPVTGARLAGGGSTEGGSSSASSVGSGSTAVAEPPSRPAPPPLPVTPRVAVVGAGEPVLAVAVEEWLEEELAARGIDVVAEDSVLAVGDLLRDSFDVATLLRLLSRSRIHVLVLVEADFVSERALRYLNRSDQAVTSRLRLNVFVTESAAALWPGWSEELEYTEVNARRQAETALLPIMQPLVSDLESGWESYRRAR